MGITDSIYELLPRIGMRRPARFRIERLKLEWSTPWPWLVHDKTRPGVYGHAVDHAAAIALVWLIARGLWGTAARVEREVDGERVVVAYITGAS